VSINRHQLMAALTSLPPSDAQNLSLIAVPLSPATTAHIIHGQPDGQHGPETQHSSSANAGSAQQPVPRPIIQSHIQPSPEKPVFKMRGQLAGSFN
jgi:hypothetical protein